MAIHHRLGVLQIGDSAVIVAASAPHRAEAFAACRAAIERLKQDVPIWKREVATDGQAWVVRGRDAAAGQAHVLWTLSLTTSCRSPSTSRRRPRPSAASPAPGRGGDGDWYDRPENRARGRPRRPAAGVLSPGPWPATPRSSSSSSCPGISGLIYESIWSRYIKLFVGSAATAQVLVLSLFMGGMALGSLLASRKLASVRAPVRVYGLIEGGIGLYALAFPLISETAMRLCYDHVFPQLGGGFAVEAEAAAEPGNTWS